MKHDGSLSCSDYTFCSPDQWSKHVELPKVTIDKSQLAKAWDEIAKDYARIASSGRCNAFDELCGKLGLL
jgi:hypothetical protein